MGYELRVCECGNEFEPWQYNQKQCGTCVEKYNKKSGRTGSQRKPKKCPNCSSEFLPRTPRHTYCTTDCRESHSYAHYLRAYNLTKEGFDEIMNNAEHLCQICGGEGFIMNKQRHKNKLVIDHCHETGVIRGALCHNCNRALGLFKDSVGNLKNAIEYLQSATTIENASGEESQ